MVKVMLRKPVGGKQTLKGKSEIMALEGAGGLSALHAAGIS